jgi:hypothetical protein
VRLGGSSDGQYGLEHVVGHKSAQKSFRKLSFGHSKSPRHVLRNGANGAFGANLLNFVCKIKCQMLLCGATSILGLEVGGSRQYCGDEPKRRLPFLRFGSGMLRPGLFLKVLNLGVLCDAIGGRATTEDQRLAL